MVMSANLRTALMVASMLHAVMGGAEVVPRAIFDDPLAGHRLPRRPSERYRGDGRPRPAGSKLSRKAARGKL